MSNIITITTAGPEVASALAILGAASPNEKFSIDISGGNLAALLAGAAIAGAPALVNVAPAPVKFVQAVEAPVFDTMHIHSTMADTGKRIRRTKEENAAGLTLEEAEAFRAQTVYGDPQSFKASLDDSKQEAPAPIETIEAPAKLMELFSHKAPVQVSAEVTESDLRAAAAAAVAAGHKTEVMKVAADAGVKKWSELDPSKYGAVLAELTSLMVIN